MGNAGGRAVSRSERIGLVVGLFCGLPFIAIGVLNIASDADAIPLSNYFRFLIVGNLVHDFVIVPVAAVIGWTLVRRVRGPAHGPLRAALFGTAVVIAIAWPALRGYGHHQAPDNPSVQPLYYPTAVLTAIGVTWALAAAWFVVSVVRPRRCNSRAPRGGSPSSSRVRDSPSARA
jgi:hypothetical protein